MDLRNGNLTKTNAGNIFSEGILNKTPFPYNATCKLIVLIVLMVLLISLFSCGGTDKEKMTIAVIPKATTHVYWQSVHAGAIKAAEELAINIDWIGTEKEDDRQQQIALVDNQVMNQVDGIVLAPLDAMALRRPVKSAVQHGIPVVIIDSNLKNSSDIYTSFVATDNRQGGRIAGKRLAQMLNKKGKVVMLRYLEGSASTENREEGFLEALEQFPDIEVLSDEQYAGATKAKAQQASENLLFRFKDQNGNLIIDGLFCPNESSTYGMLQALRRQRLTGTVKFVGFDASPALIDGLKKNDIHGLVVQNPFQMGYLGVKTLYQHIQGEQVEKRIDTGVTFVTANNIESEKIQKLIDPDLDKWLKRE